MTQGIPANFRLSFSADMIRNRVQQIGKLIVPWATAAEKQTGRQVLTVCVLRGGVFFFSDLLRAVPISVEPTYCRTWSYSSVSNEQYKEGTRVAIDEVEASGRAILLVDDICDTGATLMKLEKVLMSLGAAEVKSCVLIRRQIENPKFEPTWVGFEYGGDEWFVGYGLDDANSFSNLPDIHTIVK